MTSVWFEGADQLSQLAADLGHASVSTIRDGSKLVAKTAADIERDAKAFCPVDTGNLRNSIGHEMTGALSAEIGPSASYGGYVEYGTSRMAPQAYMGPATDRNNPAFYAGVELLGGRLLEGG